MIGPVLATNLSDSIKPQFQNLALFYSQRQPTIHVSISLLSFPNLFTIFLVFTAFYYFLKFAESEFAIPPDAKPTFRSSATRKYILHNGKCTWKYACCKGKYVKKRVVLYRCADLVQNRTVHAGQNRQSTIHNVFLESVVQCSVLADHGEESW